VDPENVTIRDQGEFIVEDIVNAVMDQCNLVNIASRPVVNPSGPIATALLDDTLSSAKKATGRRIRKRLRLQQSYAAETRYPKYQILS